MGNKQQFVRIVARRHFKCQVSQASHAIHWKYSKFSMRTTPLIFAGAISLADLPIGT